MSTKPADPKIQQAKRSPDELTDSVATDQSLLHESQKKLLAFEVAEEAQRQILWRFKWIAGLLAFVMVTLGLKTYMDIHEKIQTAIDSEINVAREKSKKSIDEFQERASQSLERIRTLEGNVKIVAQNAELSILSITNQSDVRQDKRTVGRTRRERPIGPGLSISALNTSAGTLCCIVKDSDGIRYALTASFIVSGYNDSADTGQTVVQPGVHDGGKSEDAVGSVVKSTRLASLVQLDKSIDVYTDVPEIGKLVGVGQPKIGELVRKYGRTTGLTKGQIVSSESVQVNLFGSDSPINGYRVEPQADVEYSMGGDAGAPVVNSKGELVGIHLMGNNPSVMEEFGIFVPVKPIFGELGVELVTTP